jgi:hypothetical protein
VKAWEKRMGFEGAPSEPIMYWPLDRSMWLGGREGGVTTGSQAKVDGGRAHEERAR